MFSGGVEEHCTEQKMKFSFKDFFSKCDQITADLVASTEIILNGKLHFFGQCWLEIGYF